MSPFARIRAALTFLTKAAVLGAVIALAAPMAVQSQDVTLISRNGALRVSGTLTSYDGAYFRVASPYGLLTIAADSVVCEGPACPDLLAPKAVIRLTGDKEAGEALLPDLIAAFAESRGLDVRAPSSGTGPTQVLQKDSDTVLAEFYFTPAAPQVARTALQEVRADLMIARFAPPEATAQVLAQDALVPIVAPDNPASRITAAQLAGALSGAIDNWQDLGGPDMPLVLHGLSKDSDLSTALAARLGQELAPAKTHTSLDELANAVARDPWALAVTGRANVGPARALDLQDSCGFVLDPSPLAVMAQDYPLTLPIYVVTPPRRQPSFLREFLEFLALPAAQEVMADQGFVARTLQSRPLAQDGPRLINAIKAAQDDAELALLQRLAQMMETAQRMSVSFRFEEDSSQLDAVSQTHLAELSQRVASGQVDGASMVLVGFSVETGSGEGEYTRSIRAAEGVLAGLKALAPDIPADQWPRVDGFGAALPMACDSTPAGAKLNRRVELWLLPPSDLGQKEGSDG